MNDDVTPPTPSPAEPAGRQRRGSRLLLGFFALIGVALLAVFVIGLLNPPSVRVGAGQAPEVAFTTFDGERMRLSDFRGKPVVMNFWASWCVPCREEAATLEQAWKTHQDKVQFVGLAYLDQDKNALPYLKEFGITFPNGHDLGSKAYTAYHVQGVPETFFIDADGNIQGYFVGPIPPSELEQRIQALLATSSS